MDRITKRRFYVFVLAAAIIYLIAASTIPSAVFVQVLNGLFLGFSVAVSVVFAPLFWRALKEPEFDDVSQLTIGMGLMWCSIWFARALNAYGQTRGFEKVINSPLVGFSAYLGVVGLMLHITAPGMVSNRWVYNRRIVYAAIGGGLLVAATVIWIQGR